MRTALITLVLSCAAACGPVTHGGGSTEPQFFPKPDSELCGAMCEHIGPSGLKCPESDAVYDSDLPGDAGVPNKSCEQFCKDLLAKGVRVNPRCVMHVHACSEIEPARKKVCQ